MGSGPRESLLEGIIHSIAEPVFVKDSEHRWILVNDAYCTLVGRSRDELLGHSDHDCYRREEADEFWAMDDRVLASGVLNVNDEPFTDASGTTHVIRTRKRLLIHPETGEKLLVGLITDITVESEARRQLQEIRDDLERQVEERTAELLRTNRELIEIKEMAEKASQAKTTFLANMSHEVRTPLNGVLGTVDLLRLTPLSDEQREYLDITRASAADLLRIINDVLDVAAIEAGRLKLESTPFVLMEQMDAVLKGVMVSARNPSVHVAYHVDSRVPGTLVGDAVRFKQILSNLVSNAVKFTDRGHVTVEVIEKERTQGRSLLCVIVTDTGIGIPGDRIPELFQPFTQLDSSTSKRYGGTGLGLSIVALLTRRMGGTVEVQSTPGRGSTFTCEIPFVLAPEWLDGEGGAGAPAPCEKPPARILVAEDQPICQQIMHLLCKKLGYHQLVFVENGREAVEAMAAGGFDLVLMDIQMPEMDGLEATRAIRDGELERGLERTPIIAVTAYAMEADRQKCLDAGADAYLTKPVHILELQQAMEHALGLSPVHA